MLNREPYILGFYFHKIFPTKKDRTPMNGDVSEGMTVSSFERFVQYFKKRNFNFINEHDLNNLHALKSKKNLFLSLDDGYYNNFLLLPILDKYNVKATVFVCSSHCQNNKDFWWDILARERHKQNLMTEDERKNEISYFYSLKWQDQDQILQHEFGKDVLYSKNDFIRPMNRTELGKFCKNKNITIGNHTTNHQNLTLLNKEEIENCIDSSRIFLEQITQTKVNSLAYPYGFYPDNIELILKKHSTKIGVTVETGKNYIKDLNPYRIKRNILSGYFNMDWQCKEQDHSFSFAEKFRRFAIDKP